MAAELADSMRADVLGVVTVSAAPGSTGRRSHDEVLAQLEADARGTATGALIPLAAEAILVDIDAAHAAAEVTDVPEVRVPLATIRGRDSEHLLVSGRRARSAAGEAWPGRPGGASISPRNHFQVGRPTQELLGAVRGALAFVSGVP